MLRDLVWIVKQILAIRRELIDTTYEPEQPPLAVVNHPPEDERLAA